MPDRSSSLAAAEGLVNATPVGMEKYPGMALPAHVLSASLGVADLIYFPLETDLLCESRRRGCRTLSGAGTAVHQATDAFRLFSGEEPDVDRMMRFFSRYEDAG